jgi:threonine dehydrogenase-like Zn-dependent dehydrogenase
MRALQLVAPHTLQFVDAPAPDLLPGQVIVRMDYLALCGSDMLFYERKLPDERYPLAVGRPCHECAATVDASSVPAFTRGQRVIALTHTGGLVESASVPADLLVPLPETDLDPALWVLCQPMGTVIYAMQRIGSVLGKRVVVVGQGPIGLCFTDLLVRQGAAQVIVTDVHDFRLAVARRLGATHAINAAREDVVARVAEITGGELADIGVEACGLEDTYHQVFATIRRLGTVVIFGVPHLEDTVRFNWGSVYSKLPTIIVTNSSRAGERTQSVATCVDLVAQRRLDLSYLDTNRFSWEEIPRAFEMYSTQKDRSLKGIIQVR